MIVNKKKHLNLSSRVANAFYYYWRLTWFSQNKGIQTDAPPHPQPILVDGECKAQVQWSFIQQGKLQPPELLVALPLRWPIPKHAVCNCKNPTKCSCQLLSEQVHHLLGWSCMISPRASRSVHGWALRVMFPELTAVKAWSMTSSPPWFSLVAAGDWAPQEGATGPILPLLWFGFAHQP